MIWFLAHLLPSPSPVSKLDLPHTGRLRKRDNLLRGEGGRGRSQIKRQRENLVLYESLILFGPIPLPQFPPQESKIL